MQLKSERGIGFEDVVVATSEGRVLDQLAHPNQQDYPRQTLLVIEKDKYVYVVPCVTTAEKIFFKTIYPSRKFTKAYIKGGQP
ncbi:MAG: toxin [Candidatus Saccharimonadales bacterium]